MIDMQYGVLAFSLISYFKNTCIDSHEKCTVKICFMCIEAKFIFMMDFNIYIYIYIYIYISLFMHTKGIVL